VVARTNDGNIRKTKVGKMDRMNGVKPDVSKRKVVYIFIILCLLSLTACMSREEREKANNNEALAKPIVQEYLQLNYGSGEIKSLNCLEISNSGSAVPNFNNYASPYVKALVIVDEKEFSAIINVETGQCYDNYNEGLVVEDLKNYVVSSLSIPDPYEMEVHYYLKDFRDMLGDSHYANFTEYGISSVEDLFKNDQYQIYVVCKYIASDMDFGSVDTKSFFPESEVSDVNLALINFRSKDRYISDDMVAPDYFYFEGDQHFYSLSDVVTAHKGEKYDFESENYVYDDSIKYNYAHYPSKSINGIEFAWNDSVYALDFEVVPAEKELEKQYYSGATFYSTNEIAVSIECTSLLDNTDGIDKRIYCYFDKALQNSQVIVTENNDNQKNYEIWTLDWKTDSYIYRWLYTYDKKASFTLGFYERK